MRGAEKLTRKKPGLYSSAMIKRTTPLARVLVVLTVAACGAGVGSTEQTGSTSSAVTVCGPTTVTGIDVYHGDNGGAAIDWNAVKAGGASFAFAKATESTNFDDPMFTANWSGMKAAGLVRGAYHFFDPAADPTMQAAFFTSAVGPVEPGDLLVLDFETSGGLSDSALAAAAVTFLSTVQQSTGVTPLLYASSEFLSNFGPLGVYPLWVANYGVMCPDVPAAWTTYTFWQSSGTGSAPGIAGQVDVDSFNGTLAQLQAFAASTAGDAGTPPGDAGASDAPADTSTISVDSGPLADSAPTLDTGVVTEDSATPAEDSGLVVQDSGAAGRPADTGDLVYATSRPKGCACNVRGGGSGAGAASKSSTSSACWFSRCCSQASHGAVLRRTPGAAARRARGRVASGGPRRNRCTPS